MYRIKVFAGVIAGVVLVSGLLRVESRSEGVFNLSSGDLAEVWGGDICYIPGNWTCGDSPTPCPSHDCKRDVGHLTVTCWDGGEPEQKAKKKTQPTYAHYATSSSGLLELTDPVEEPCNVIYWCGCYDHDENDETIEKCTGDEDYISFFQDGQKFDNQEPTGGICPAE